MQTEPEEVERVMSVPPPTPSKSDAAYVSALREAGVLKDIGDVLLQVLQERLGASHDAFARRLDLIELYYQGGGDEEIGRKRVLEDRFFCHRSDEPISAHGIVRRIAGVTPELTAVRLERIGAGDSDDGPLVLRAGDHLAAVEEHDEADLDTDEIDLNELSDVSTISVRALVGAVNVLLDRHDIRERLVLLPTDGGRESFIATGVTEAMLLCKNGFLEETAPESLIEFGGW